jgi:hypothetical protein
VEISLEVPNLVVVQVLILGMVLLVVELVGILGSV